MTQRPFGGKGPEALPWHPLPYMQEYLDNLEADGRTDGYTEKVLLGLKRFALFLEVEGVKLPDEITRVHILHYQQHLAGLTKNGEPLTLSYRQQMMKYARGWINWLQDVEYIEHNPWVRIRIGQVAKKPKPLEDDEVDALFAAHRQQAFAIPPFFYHRREVILVLLLGWGLRIHELRSLTVTKLDARLDWVIVRNKGGGEKILPWAEEMKAVVARYLTHRSRHQQTTEDSLLIDQQGRPLSDAMVRKIVVDCGVRAGIQINPHRLRDTCATTLLDNDVEVERIMKILGHTQRAQTMAYARLNEPKVKESHDEVMNPLFQRLLGGKLP